MAMQNDYIRSLEDQIEATRRFLRPFEDGTMHIGRRPAGGEWTDMTQEWIAQDRAVIATLERLLEKAREGADHPE